MGDFQGYAEARGIKLEGKGAERRACCPIHNGKRDSFALNVETGQWQCFSDCSDSGDVFKLEMLLTGKTFKEVVPVLAEFGIEPLKKTGTGSTSSSRSTPRPSSTRSTTPKPKASGEEAPKVRQFGKMVASYDYHDREGNLLYQVRRYEPKAFAQFTPDGKGGWKAGLKGLDRTLYRLHQVVADPESTVWIVEGEKDADNLRIKWRLNATCNSGGAGKFTASMARELAGRNVVIIPDIDDDQSLPPAAYRKGEKHAEAVATLLSMERCRVKIVRVPAHDVSEWMDAGGTIEELAGLVANTPEWGRKVDELPEVPETPGGLPANVYEMQQNYVILVGSDEIWDQRRGCTMTPSDLRLAHASDYNVWLKSPDTRRIDREKLVFEPGGCKPDELNLFRGLTMAPDPSKPCDRLKEHMAFLCGGDPQLTHWLTAWLAYPLQHLGAKMKTSVVVHGPQGTGKSLLFEQVVKMYEPYSDIIGQLEIESPYTAWASRKLFILADEVLTKAEARQVKNRLKSLITGELIGIENKHEKRRVEANHMNLVFLSNEDMPVIIERSDRRFTVLQVEQVQPPAYYEAIAKEIDNGGVEGLMAYLLNYDLQGFNEHAKPYMTDAKIAIVEACLSPAEKFNETWIAGDLPVPWAACATADLYEAFRLWATTSGERYGLPTSTAFIREMAKIYGGEQAKMQMSLDDGRRAMCLLPLGEALDRENRPPREQARVFKVRLDGWLSTVQERRI